MPYPVTLTVSSVARRAGLSRGYVYRVLKGQRGLSLYTAARIAKAAGVTIDQLYAYILKLGVRPTGRRTLRNPDPKKLAARLVSVGYQITPMD